VDNTQQALQVFYLSKHKKRKKNAVQMLFQVDQSYFETFVHNLKVCSIFFTIVLMQVSHFYD